MKLDMKNKMKTMDGNTAAAYAAYAFTDIAAIYPITPSSVMAENVDEWSAQGRKNIFGEKVQVVEMQSEGGVSGTVHGALQCGSLTTTFTASQGLLLMIPNMYRIAGELLPAVFHVSARTVATHATSIFGDHSDVMATRQTGFALLASGSVQEVMDLAGVAHLCAIQSRVPFLHFFDGFRTSHEVQKINVIDYADFAKLMDREALQSFRDRALLPERPVLKGTVQNADIFFQAREACNPFYDALPDMVEAYMQKITALTGREYHPFNYYGAADAEDVIVAMGSGCDTIEETVDYLREKGKKVGVLKVHLYRPFSAKYFLGALPETVQRIAVLDRTKEPGSQGEPLFEDVCTVFNRSRRRPLIIGGRYGLSSKETTPSDINAVFENLQLPEPKDDFTVGINDDLTFRSLTVRETLDTTPQGTISCKFWGFGSDGTVGANKSAIKIIGDNTPLFAQGYFAYDSKKSGGVTVSHLRFGQKPIKSAYLINHADYIACHNQSYVGNYDLLAGLKKGGTFLLNCLWTPEELSEKLPAEMKRFLARQEIKFYTIDAIGMAQKIGLGSRINMIMQSAFFKLAGVMPVEEAVLHLKDEIKKNYGAKGEEVVHINFTAVDRALDSLVKIAIPADWAETADEEACAEEDVPEFVKKIIRPVGRQMGDTLPVSAFAGWEDGRFPVATSRYEKRGVAVSVPAWQKENCIQCNRCSFVCPHGAIRPFLLNDEEKAGSPAGFQVLSANGRNLKGYSYRVQVSPLDCTGCGSCLHACPAKKKALVMKPLAEIADSQAENWLYAMTLSRKDHLVDRNTVRGSQYAQPLIEFPGACAGCGEAPYAKLATQLFGDKMIIANATGCSLIWSGSAPVVPYCTNEKGHGPAWANSLFEDNAEFGFGMYLSVKKNRDRLVTLVEEARCGAGPELAEAFDYWLGVRDDLHLSEEAAEKLLPLLADCKPSDPEEARIFAGINELKDFLVKKSIWLWGGDGWAYDIGFGGLDHVLASGADINVLVFDTEVYSNTGGQASKSTPTGAVAKFAAGGKRGRKKDLGMMAMTYGHVYVAQVAMGADMSQLLQVLTEAEQYPGPSLVIAYAPCINHGIRSGMGSSMEEAKRAVESGYWHLYRYNPLAGKGENPFTLDSGDPKIPFREFLNGETRYTSLNEKDPELAASLFAQAEKQAEAKLASYKKLAGADREEITGVA